MTYEKYSELLISAETTHDKKIKQDTKFVSKYRRIIYEIEQLPNDDNESSFETE